MKRIVVMILVLTLLLNWPGIVMSIVNKSLVNTFDAIAMFDPYTNLGMLVFILVGLSIVVAIPLTVVIVMRIICRGEEA